jgi:hypothetical protein
MSTEKATSPNAVNNRARKDRAKRSKLKKRLRREGASEELIERIIARQRQEDLVARHGEDYARTVRREAAVNGPDDTGYTPSEGDPLLRGAARATGMTAKVVKRRDTITDWQYDRMVRSEVSDSD